MYSYQQALLLRPRTLRMVVLVTTRLRAALEMTRVARVRVVGERSGCAPPNDILSANISAVINNVIRLFIFSPPFSFRQSKTDRLFQGGGSRLRYWLCPSLLSAHHYESELLSLYLVHDQETFWAIDRGAL